MPIGGIETFIVRLASQFKQNKYTFRILFYTRNFNNELLEELKQYAEIFFLDDYIYTSFFTKKIYPLFKLLLPFKRKKLKQDVLEGITHIHAPDSNALMFSLKLLRFNNTIRLTTGIYQINEYNVKRYISYYFARHIDFIINLLPPNNIIFFNEISRDLYSRNFSRKFSNSTITPIGVDIKKYNGQISGSKTNRIVSVGRLVHWKTYNYIMIDVINKFKKDGINLIYESFGDGVLMYDLNKKVKLMGLEQNIYFHKNISYDKFKNVIDNSLMFIGSGTSLIEASACGIPALIGIESEIKSISYGFLHDTKTYSYHENSLSYPTSDIEFFIKKLLKSTPQEYSAQCKQARARANDFTIERSYEGFLEMCNNSKVWNMQSSTYSDIRFIFSLIIHFFISKIMKTYKKSFFNRFAIEI